LTLFLTTLFFSSFCLFVRSFDSSPTFMPGQN